MSHSGTIPRISPAAIQEARLRIRAEFLDSPQLENHRLSQAVGTRLLCKDETRNAVGSFKGRGTDSFIGSLTPEVKSLVTASAGNFGLALAYAAKRRSNAVTIFAAETASPIKLDRIRSAGAELKLAGRDFDEAKEHARAAAKEMHAMFVEDGREPAITAGAGTIGMELTDSADKIDTMVVPLGNGALLAGIGCWLRSRSPQTRIIGVCAKGAPAMALSWHSHAPQNTSSVDTIADGIAVRVPVREALRDLENVLDDIVLVSDDAIKQALKLVHRHLNVIAEPAGVAGVAALLSHSSVARGLVCTPITGGNVAKEQLRQWLAETQ
ncbi:MAG TPA: pyridoxal-phosphate dependent enzyme [Terriglobales bacterium]|nr:pyridoxal-phosphate dependent enzyme [Terriglobales bacterium]